MVSCNSICFGSIDLRLTLNEYIILCYSTTMILFMCGMYGLLKGILLQFCVVHIPKLFLVRIILYCGILILK